MYAAAASSKDCSLACRVEVTCPASGQSRLGVLHLVACIGHSVIQHLCRMPLEDGMDLLDHRTQRLAVRKALSHSMSFQPELLNRLDTPESATRLHKLQHAKSDLNGYSASPKHGLKALKVRVKNEDKTQQQLNGLESPAAADAVQQRKGKGGAQTPRDHHLLSSEATPRSRNAQLHRMSDSLSRSHHLVSLSGAPMAQLVESDLFGDFMSRKGSMEGRTSAGASPRMQSAVPSPLQTSAAVPTQEAAATATAPQQPAQKTGLKVVLKQHRLAVSDAARAASELAVTVSAAAELSNTPATKLSAASAEPEQAEAEAGPESHLSAQNAKLAHPAPAQKVHSM